jgi:glycosyltransferase involved in cell wall biosynthesis
VLRLVYLSRIDNHKNLLFLIETINSVGGDIRLDVFGDIRDERYHSICVDKAKNNRAITFKGPIDNALVPATLSQYDFLALPTKGENFGHVILEALVARCPPIISDQTPWNDIETAGAGMVRTLDFDTWQKCLSECVAMTNEQHRKMKAGSKMFAESFLQNEEREKQTRELLRRTCSG